MRSPSVRRTRCLPQLYVPFWGETTLALLSAFDMLAILSPFNNNNAACLTLVALTIQNWKKQWSLTLEMMRPLTNLLTVSHVNNNRDFTIQRRDVNYSLNFIRLLRIIITPSTRTSHKKWIWILSVFIAIIPTHFVNVGEPAWNWIPRIPYPGSKREIIFRRCLFTRNKSF